MSRTKITAYFAEATVDAVKRLAALKDRSLSDVVEEAVIASFEAPNHDIHFAALTAKLDLLYRRLGIIERAQETLFELTAHHARFAMSLAPEIPPEDRAHLNARGAERFQAVLGAITRRLAAGRSVWRHHFAGAPLAPTSSSAANGAAPSTAQGAAPAAGPAAEAPIPPSASSPASPR